MEQTARVVLIVVSSIPSNYLCRCPDPFITRPFPYRCKVIHANLFSVEGSENPETDSLVTLEWVA